MVKKNALILLAILILGMFTATAAYGEKGVAWLQEKNILPAPLAVPKVWGEVRGDHVVLKWQQIEDERLQGYRVVIAKDNPNPSFPADGYLCFITDGSETQKVVDNSEAYSSGDFGDFLVPGERYYFSVTAVYKGEMVAGNVVKAIFPKVVATPDPKAIEEAYIAPQVTGKVTDGKIKLSWQPIKDPRLKGYKVVISKGNPNPSYPKDGYLSFITDVSRTYMWLDTSQSYKEGDFGKHLVAGKSYYFSITAVYGDKSVAGNVVKLKYPAPKVDVKPEPKPDPKPDPKPQPPSVSTFKAWAEGDIIKLSWEKGEGNNLKGYKVVISEKSSSPKYPENGYLYWITDSNKTTAVVDNKSAYSGGDIYGYLKPGNTYYFSVTYVYKDRNVAANSVKLMVPSGMHSPAPPNYVKPVITEILDQANALNYNIVVRWTWGGTMDDYFKGFKAEVTDHESGKKSYVHLGKDARELTLYCSCHNKEPKVEPYNEYTVRIIAIYQDRHEYSEPTRRLKTFGNTS
jgi:hypothetical protein